MKKTVFVFTMFIVVFILVGCGGASPSQSTFKTNFSLGSIVEANQQYLLDETRVTSGSEVGPRELFTQQHEEMIIQIDSTNISAFMEALRMEIEQELVSNTARVVGRESNGLENLEYFSFNYSEGPIYGIINVWGVRGEGTTFTLIMLITES